MCDTVRLYSAQTALVREVLLRDGVCFSRASYVERKYGESAPIFLTAYRWFAAEAAKLVPPPPGAELPYWAFRDLYSVEPSGDGRALALDVPRDQAVFFDLYDWNKMVRLEYIGETEAEERVFRRELRDRGLTGRDVMLTQFYPELRQAVLASWRRLFRHHEAIRAGDLTGVGGVQAALWQLRREWLAEGEMSIRFTSFVKKASRLLSGGRLL